MTKTFKQLMQEANDLSAQVVPAGMKPVGIQQGMDTYTLEHMDKFADQISNAFQPEMDRLLPRIELELNKFGYTLGQLDMDDIADAESDGDLEDLLIFEKSSKKMVTNAYISLDWERLTGGTTDITQQRRENLTLAVTMTIERATPAEISDMVGDADNADAGDTSSAKILGQDTAGSETGAGLEVTGTLK
jgi:hypothetical protein